MDGVGVGNIENVVLRDRKILSENGLVLIVVGIEADTQMVVSGPDVITRGFVNVKDNDPAVQEIKRCAQRSLMKLETRGVTDWNTMKKVLRSDVKSFINSTMKKTPVVLPVFIDF